MVWAVKAELKGVLVDPLERIWMVVKGISVKAILTFLKVVMMTVSKDDHSVVERWLSG